MAERLAFQTLLKIDEAGNPGTYLTVLDVQEISAPGISLDTEELTNHSQADHYRKFGGTLLDAGELSATVLYDPANATHIQLLTDIQARTLRAFRLEFPGATTNARWSFNGFITEFQPDTPTDEHLKCSISIKITASITIGDVS